MEKPDKIYEIEKENGQMSIINVWRTFELEKFKNNKKLTPIVSESILSLGGDLQYNQIIYGTPADYYLFIFRNMEDGLYHLRIYYKEEKINEVLIFLNQLIKK